MILFVKHLLISVSVSILITFLLISKFVPLPPDNWRGIIPEVTDDSFYYLARINQVANGYPLIGNPYFYEHRKEIPISFILPDILSTLPELLIHNMAITYFVNSFIWITIISFLLLRLYSLLQVRLPTQIFGLITTLIITYRYIIRPVAMQAIYPFFIIYLIGLLLYFKNPTRRNSILFIIFTTISIYVYSYLFQIIVMSLIIIALELIICRQREKFKKYLITLFTIGFFSIPYVLLNLIQINHANFYETVTRIGLTQTNIPTVSAIILSIIISAFIMFCKFDNSVYLSRLFRTTGLAMILISLNNIFTGKELETANHVWRFATIWMVAILLTSLKQNHIKLSFNYIFIFVSLTTLIILQSTYFYNNLRYDLGEKYLNNEQTREPSLTWLNRNLTSDDVIFTSSVNSYYIPIYTNSYVLFSPAGGLHLLSDDELEERYLISRIGTTVDIESLVKDYRQFGGTGKSIHHVGFYNTSIKICKLYNILHTFRTCPTPKNVSEYVGESYFENLINKYNFDILQNLDKYLDKYKITYFYVEKNVDQISINNYISKITGIIKVYEDNRFEIYKRARLPQQKS